MERAWRQTISWRLLCALCGQTFAAAKAAQKLNARLIFRLLISLCPPLVAAERPNIIIFLADDLGQRDLGCYGDERWKLIAYPKIGHLQLFDLQSDPHEIANLIDRPDHAAHVERLQRLMKQWQAKVGDTLQLPTENKAPERIDLTGQARVPDQWQPDWIVKKYFKAPAAPGRSATSGKPGVLK